MQIRRFSTQSKGIIIYEVRILLLNDNRDKLKECFEVVATFTKIKEKENSEV